MTLQLYLAQLLEKILKVAKKRGLVKKEDFKVVAAEVASKFEFTGDDWIKGFYPSETASIALTERDSEGNIIRTAIAALYDNFPIVVADKTGCYLYKNYRIRPVISVNATFIDNPEIPIRCHVFGQKPTPHWVWMNKIIGSLNKSGIRTDNSMGSYFILRNFFFYHEEIEKGIEIAPMKVVITEPYSNKPKEELGAFVIKALNAGLLYGKEFTLTNMSGKELFHNSKMERVTGCEIPYCASGWIAGPSKKLVFKVLSEMGFAVEILGEPEDTNEKVRRFVSDLNRFQI